MKIIESIRIVPVFYELCELFTGKLITRSAVYISLFGCAGINITVTPKNFTVLFETSLAAEFILEGTGAAIRSAFAFNHFHIQTSISM